MLDARTNGASTLSGPVESVVGQVMNVILGLILSGELAPGQPATIRDLSARLGVSHIPVREALRGLESKGLVTFRRGKGMQVAPVSVDDLRDIFQLRTAIEAAVAERTDRPLGGEQLREAERQFERLRLSLSGDDAFAVTVAHRAFHFALLPEATPWDKHVLDQLWTASERYLQIFVRSSEEARRLTIERHAELLTDARTMAPKELQASILRHISESLDPIAAAVSARLDAPLVRRSSSS
jgi:DNA-binding GntR family transcriptional regulator